jgi:CRISPR-associated protein Cas1
MNDDMQLKEEDLLTIDHLHQFAYCPRRAFLMYHDGRWEDNAYTAEGKEVHRKVDNLDHVLPDAFNKSDSSKEPDTTDYGDPLVTTSVSLVSQILGLSGKLDFVSTKADEAIPVEYKRGKVPATPERSWEPERMQLMAQGLLLREHGYRCDHGVLYFAGSRTRVNVPFSVELEEHTLASLKEAHTAAKCTMAPSPLDHSPKCDGCSLSGICMPDETLTLAAIEEENEPPPAPRRLYPPRDDALPFYVQTQGAHVGKTGNSITVKKDSEEIGRARLKDVSQLVLCGNVYVSAQAIHLLCEAGIPIVHVSTGNWFYGVTSGIGLKNGYSKAAQYHCAADPDRQIIFARAIVAAKGANQRTMLRRNAVPRPNDSLDGMSKLLDLVPRAEAMESLLGLEGALAANYFQSFSLMIKSPFFTEAWNFNNRNRRPPKDPINSMLSFGYAMLAKECTTTLMAEGLDPYWGLYHKPRHGRPSLALDLMEEFRPLIVDSAVITAVNTGMVEPRQFLCSKSGCVKTDVARKNFIKAYEARLDQLVTHPLFDYRCSWRSIIRIQSRFLTRWFRGEVISYTGFTTR